MAPKIIPLIPIVALSFLGLLVVVTFTHEYQHYKDFKALAIEDDFCVLNWNTNLNGSLGYYAFSYNKAFEPYVEENDMKSEFKAYTISVILIALYFLALMKVYDNYKNQI